MGFKNNEIMKFGQSGEMLPYDDAELSKVRALTAEKGKSLILLSFKCFGERNEQNANLCASFEMFAQTLSVIPGAHVIAIFDSCRNPRPEAADQAGEEVNYVSIYREKPIGTATGDPVDPKTQNISGDLFKHMQSERKSREGKAMMIPDDLHSFSRPGLEINIQGFPDEIEE